MATRNGFTIEGIGCHLFQQPPNTASLRGIYDVHPTPREHRAHDGRTRRVFKEFLWLEVGSIKAALSRPA
ncbi:MAG TPA: hypothetical protein VK206_10985 [Anaerolineales bacterium]|nr:hypothetical protein [Anaerolineales bacterium]